MQPSEFDRWWNDLTQRFPSVREWVGKHFAREHQQVSFLRTWHTVLGDVGIADALEVNRLMQAGELAWAGEYDGDKERLPQHVRRLARQLSWDREEHREEHREESEPARRDTDFPAGKILARLLDLIDKGMPRDEARARVLEEMPVGRSTREPRYSCLLCRDTGRVLVASNAAIEAMIRGTFHECHHRNAVMVCTCKPPIARKHRGKEYRIETFNPALDFSITDPIWQEREVNRFRDWIDVQREKRAQAVLESRANYERQFDSFNRREFAS